MISLEAVPFSSGSTNPARLARSQQNGATEHDERGRPRAVGEPLRDPDRECCARKKQRQPGQADRSGDDRQNRQQSGRARQHQSERQQAEVQADETEEGPEPMLRALLLGTGMSPATSGLMVWPRRV